jgi:hypothetical protein
VVIQVIYKHSILPIEHEYHAPIAINRQRTLAFQVALQRVQGPSGCRQIFGLNGLIKCSQLKVYLNKGESITFLLEGHKPNTKAK